MDSNTDAALVTKLTRRLFKTKSQGDIEAAGSRSQGPQRIRHRYSDALKGGAFLCSHACRCLTQMPKHSSKKHRRVQLAAASFKQEGCRDFGRGTGGAEGSGVAAVAGTSRSVSDSAEARNGVFCEQVSEDRARTSGVSLPDGEGLDVDDDDAGTEINEEEAVALMNSDSDREGHEGDGHEENRTSAASFELLDNGMPKDMDDFGPGADVEELWPAEMFVPGLVVHLVRTAGDTRWFGLPKSLTFSTELVVQERPKHTAVLKDRKLFRDILVTPAMFLDHMPWK